MIAAKKLKELAERIQAMSPEEFLKRLNSVDVPNFQTNAGLEINVLGYKIDAEMISEQAYEKNSMSLSISEFALSFGSTEIERLPSAA